MSFALFFFGFFSFVFAMGYFLDRAARKRRDALAVKSAELGLSFERHCKLEDITTLAHFRGFKRASDRDISNVMRGRIRERLVVLFEYNDSLSDTSIPRTVALVPQVSTKVPDFLLFPNVDWQVLLRILFGDKRIEFQTSPEFSKQYVLRGLDESAIREVFNETALSFFAEHHNLHVESRQGSLVVWKPLISPMDLPSFVFELERMLSVLLPEHS